MSNPYWDHYDTQRWKDNTDGQDPNQLHREDGPAVIYEDGKVEYWVHGKKLTEEEFKHLKEKK
jgi:hypothetical protein